MGMSAVRSILFLLNFSAERWYNIETAEQSLLAYVDGIIIYP